MADGGPFSSPKELRDAESVPDERLMRRVQAGDRNAFALLVRRHQTPLLNFFRRLGVKNDGEDLVQETLVRLYNCRRRWKPSGRFSGFLFRIATRIHLDYVRKNGRRRALLMKAARKAEIVQEPPPRADEVVDALARLPLPQRQVVVLKIYHDMKYAEIAEVLEIPEGTAKSRMFNALCALRELLGEGGNEKRPEE